MAKKSKKNRSSLFSLLLRDLKERPDSVEKLKLDKKSGPPFLLGSDKVQDKPRNRALLSFLLREAPRRPTPEEIRARDKKNACRLASEEGDEEDEEDDLEYVPLKPQTGKNMIEKRFETLPSRTLENDYQKRVSGGNPGTQGDTSKNRITADNYQQMYLEQKAEEEAHTAKKTQEALKAGGGSSPQSQAEQQRVLNLKYRARDLQMQIEHWKNQRGQGTYDDVTVNTNLTKLEYELNSIPPMYWRM